MIKYTSYTTYTLDANLNTKIMVHVQGRDEKGHFVKGAQQTVHLDSYEHLKKYRQKVTKLQPKKAFQFSQHLTTMGRKMQVSTMRENLAELVGYRFKMPAPLRHEFEAEINKLSIKQMDELAHDPKFMIMAEKAFSISAERDVDTSYNDGHMTDKELAIQLLGMIKAKLKQ